MSNQVTRNPSVTELVKNSKYKARFEDVLGNKAAGFTSSLINLVKSNDLTTTEPMSVLSSAMIAATLDLPIDKNLGFAWIVPYYDKKAKVKIAQFQMGYKGYVQLALRTGQYKNINAIPVYDGQFKKWNPLTEELEIDFNIVIDYKEEPIGYAGYFELLNGFRKTVYWTKKEIEKHGQKFSKTYNSESDFNIWKKDFDAMATKTVIKNLISKWGIMSIEMQTAVISDQSAVKMNENLDINSADYEYIDNQSSEEEIAEKANTEELDFESDKKDSATDKVVDVEFEKVEEKQIEGQIKIDEDEVPY